MSAEASHPPVTPARVLGQRLREIREKRGLSQAAFADLLGLDRTTLNKIENGTRSDVRISELFRFATVLDIAPIHLLVPLDGDGDIAIAPFATYPAPIVRMWIRGEVPHPEAGTEGHLRFLQEMPERERREWVEKVVARGMVEKMDPLTRAIAGESYDAAVAQVRRTPQFRDSVDGIVRVIEGQAKEETDA
jgi:transcriptional regulator with XRE-family HTH domain